MGWTPETNRIPFGLLTDDEKAALRACKHGWEFWDGTHWKDKVGNILCPSCIYRAKPAPRRIVTWHNVYPDFVDGGYDSKRAAYIHTLCKCICVYRITRNEDGSDPQIEVEGV